MKNDNNLPMNVDIIDETSIRDKIYEVRGVKVMLDFELAEIYGYSTKAFNQQVKRNISRFPDDFMFQLSMEEAETLSRSQKVTLNKGARGTNVKYVPHTFTESGIYMLMSVLKGDLAIQQSVALIRAFRTMKDYVIENQNLIGRHEFTQLQIKISENRISELENRAKLTD